MRQHPASTFWSQGLGAKACFPDSVPANTRGWGPPGHPRTRDGVMSVLSSPTRLGSGVHKG